MSEGGRGRGLHPSKIFKTVLTLTCLSVGGEEDDRQTDSTDGDQLDKQELYSTLTD